MAIVKQSVILTEEDLREVLCKALSVENKAFVIEGVFSYIMDAGGYGAVTYGAELKVKVIDAPQLTKV